MGTPFDKLERRDGEGGRDTGSPARSPSPATATDELIAELRLIRRELTELRQLRIEVAGLRADLRAARAEDTATDDDEEAAARRRPSLPAPVAALATRVRSAGATARATLASWRAGPEWAPPRAWRWDVAALLVILVAAWLLRYVDLGASPPGLHGDEAATGLEARRIAADGWIGVYTGIAGGNPTGVYYLAAIPVSLIDDPVVAVRLLSVVGGVLAVAALYALVRRSVGFGSAVVAASTLAVSEWHLQFSRTGFVTGLWLPVVLVGAVALMEAVRTSRWWWWAASGAILGSGVYVYNGHTPFLLVLGVFIGWRLFGWTAVAAVGCLAVAAVGCLAVATQGPWWLALALVAAAFALLIRTPRLRERGRLINAGAFAAAALVVMRGMILFARNHRQEYFGRSEQLSVFRTPEWKATAGLGDQARFLLDRYRDFWDRLTFVPRPDGVDLGGVTAIVPELTLYLCLAGLVIALVRRPSPLVVLAVFVVAATPLTAVLTDLTPRRALVIAPFLALLAGVGVVEVARVAIRRGRVPGVVGGVVLVGLLAVSGYQNLDDFFDTTVASGPVQHTFAVELRDTAEYLDTLPDDAHVLFFSDRWVLEYDVVRLLAPDVAGENRSPIWGGTGTLEVDRAKGAPVFVLMGPHADRLPELQALYPGGEVVMGEALPPPRDGPAFVAYVLPPP